MKQIIINHITRLIDKLIGNLASDASAEKKEAYGFVLLELVKIVKVIKSL